MTFVQPASAEISIYLKVVRFQEMTLDFFFSLCLLPRLGKVELMFLLSFPCNYVNSVRRGFLFLLVLGMGSVILLWHI